MATSILERGARWLKDRLDVSAAVNVRYVADNESLDELAAVPGRRDIEQYLLEESPASAQSFDWCVLADDLVIGGQRIDPRPPHQILYEMSDGRTAVYKVLPDPTERSSDTMDQLGIMIRIHTKLDRIA